MKIKLVILVLLIAGTTFSQGYRKHKWGPREKMDQLEQIKLLEVLDLDEETSVRFITRRNEFKDLHRETMEERKSLISEMEQALNEGKTQDEFDYESSMSKLENLEKKFIQQRIAFIKSLNDLLTTEQIAKLIVFESKFMEEVRNVILRKGGRGRMGPPGSESN